MTISTTASSVTIAGNGATTSFGFNFIAGQASNIVVTYTDANSNETVLTQGSQYTLTINAAAAGQIWGVGGSVTYPISGSPIASGTYLTIERVVPFTQLTSISNQGDFYPQAVEQAMDTLEMQIQQVDFLAARAIVINPADTTLPNPLPIAAVRASQYLVFDSFGNPTTGAPVSAVTVSTAMQPVVAASTVVSALSLLGGQPLATAMQWLVNIAALRAATPTSPTLVVQGYYSPGVAGSIYTLNASDTTSADNGGTIIIDGSGRRWYLDALGLAVSIMQFGAKMDGATDDTTAIQACVTASESQGFEIFIPVGVSIVSTTITISSAVTIRGVNPGIGPGLTTAVGASVILRAPAFTTGNVFVATTNYSCIFSDFQIAGALGLGYTSACPSTGGSGIVISGPSGSTNMGSVIDHVAFTGIYQPIQLIRCAENTVTRNCYAQAWGNTAQAFYAGNGGTSVESSCGQIVENMFFGNPAATQVACVEAHCGYGSIVRNKCLGAQYGVRVIGDQSVSIGNVQISLNSFEEITVQSVLVTQLASVQITSIKVVNNQFSNISNEGLTGHIVVQPEVGGASTDLIDVIIAENSFNTQTTASGAAFIVTNATNVKIIDNVGQVLGGTAIGISVSASSGPTAVEDNQIIANGGTLGGTQGYYIASPTLLRDTRGGIFTAANVNSFTNAINGSELYATDGQATSTSNVTVVGSGSGCIAWRMRGAWLTLPITG